MRKIFLSYLLIGSGICCYFSCHKNGATPTNKTTTVSNFVSPPEGNWKIIADSTFIPYIQTTTIKVYNGKAGDYFNFAAGGKLYVREGNTLDTLTYTYLTADSVYIGSFLSAYGLNAMEDSCRIRQTDTSMYIAGKIFITPEGMIGRRVTLSK